MFQIRPNVLRMRLYSPGKPVEEVQRELGLSRVVKLASNENPLGPSPLALEAVRKATSNMHIYPDASGYAVKAKLAELNNLSPDQILLGNGSDELIHMLGAIYLNPGDNIVIAKPTFVRYEAVAHLADIAIKEVNLTPTFEHNLPAMAAATDHRTKLIFLPNPHNPTGTVISQNQFDTFLDALPDTALVVLDEAYYEYASHLNNHPNSTDCVRAGRNVVGLRTMSKAYGLAGIRLGYGFAPPEITDAINRAREPFNVNSLAQAAAIAALDDATHLMNTRTLNQEGLAKITHFCRQNGLDVIPSHANFICIDVKQPATAVFEALLKKGIIVRSGEPLGMPTYLRVSIGTAEEIGQFLTALSDALELATPSIPK